MIRTLAFPLLAVSAAFMIPRRRLRIEQYVGDGDPTAEIHLLLARTGEFRLTMAVWDPVVGTVVGQRELVGRWRRGWGQLELRSSTRRVVYRRAAQGAAWIWQRSSLPTFADGIPLVPERSHPL